LDETRSAHVDPDTHLALREAAHAAADEGTLREPAPDGATRLLIRSDGEREVVHVLARKTSIGRTPDNDVQIDAKYISRRHAVILAGPAHTIIEDLNSTNGVTVNGQRITRQALKDGDHVMIGRAEYRFAVRRTDKR
jgi:pSer/pThr/pTyr-binding forkhead associated (FHA) protein